VLSQLARIQFGGRHCIRKGLDVHAPETFRRPLDEGFAGKNAFLKRVDAEEKIEPKDWIAGAVSQQP